jgi:hypothetical protein
MPAWIVNAKDRTTFRIAVDTAANDSSTAKPVVKRIVVEKAPEKRVAAKKVAVKRAVPQ